MQDLVRRLHIVAGEKELQLIPAGFLIGGHENKTVTIAYGSNNIAAQPTEKGAKRPEGALEAYGVVGILDLGSSAHLTVITGREQVARVGGKPVYKITDVALISLASQAEAEQTIKKAASGKSKTHSASSDEESEAELSDADADADAETEASAQKPKDDVEDAVAALEPAKEPETLAGRASTVLHDVVQSKGVFGRLAGQWLSKGRVAEVKGENPGLTKEQEKQEVDALPAAESKEAPAPEATLLGEADATTEQTPKTSEEDGDAAKKPQPTQHSVIDSLTPRIVSSTRLYFSSCGFYFSYDHDISTRLALQDTANAPQPLWKTFMDEYFWNRHLVEPLIAGGQEQLVLPLLQGFVGQKEFNIARTEEGEQDQVEGAKTEPNEMKSSENSEAGGSDAKEGKTEDFLLTLISRRSTKRAGLRYLRRGIDDEGNVANAVETEQLLSLKDDTAKSTIYSLVQTRGSIPLFFSQSPYSFKPLPTQFGSEATNDAAFKKHFAKLSDNYGPVQCVSLVDKHATEAKLGESYEHHAETFNSCSDGDSTSSPLSFEWFDFHARCKGMAFQNVSQLLETLQPTLKSHGYTTQSADSNTPTTTQTGIVRTNCMDCLDRTNVVQSSIGGHILEQQLASLNLHINLQTDASTQWFNAIWADNGDAISKQYAGTAALKGDFTRTRKRHWTGALTDMTLTLTRYYNNIFGDYFLQVCIDFYLGNASAQAFEDFETDMATKDHTIDLSRVRQNAVDSCVKLAIEDPEEKFMSGWVLNCPHEANTLRSLPFEDCVLLLTDRALYFCRFDWATEKVGSFERVELLDVRELWRGVYITSTLGPSHIDEATNVGFALRYESTGPVLVRTNTRSLDNEKAVAGSEDASDGGKAEKKAGSRMLAFKALPRSSSAAKEQSGEADMSERELVEHVCDEIQTAMTQAVRKDRGPDHLGMDVVPAVEEKDVLSLADARKNTGYVESLGHSLKKLVWS